MAVQRAKPKNQAAIEAAIDACLDGKCLQGGDSPSSGKPPPVPAHGAILLFARVFAAEGEWDRCSAALRHGTTPPDPARTSKAKKP